MKKFKTHEIRGLLNRVIVDEISFSRMVEIMNEMVSEAEEKCVEDIPKRTFQKGDRVRIKEGISSKTHKSVPPFFSSGMDSFIGTIMTVSRYIDTYDYVVCNESDWKFHEDWLEQYTDELKEGDLAIFWDDHPKDAFIHLFDRHLSPSDLFPYVDKAEMRWKNAIKFKSVDQFERLLKGEI